MINTLKHNNKLAIYESAPFMEMSKISLEDKNFIKKFFKAVKYPLADTSFTMRYIWAEPFRHTWSIINGNLCFFGFHKDRYVLWGPPIGGDDINETINLCFDAVEKLNKQAGINANPTAIYIPEYLKDEYETIAKKNKYTFDFWRQDYIYNTHDLVDLNGSRFDSKRHKVNFFTKNYDYSIEEFDFNIHADDCLKLIDIWKEQKQNVAPDSWKYELEAEKEAARKLITFSRELGARGIVLNVEGKVSGVSLGESLTDEMCSNIIEKTKPALNGAAEFIFKEFAKYWSSHRFLNAQDDFGVDYLKKVKLSYHPVKLLKSYILERKNSKQ